MLTGLLTFHCVGVGAVFASYYIFSKLCGETVPIWKITATSLFWEPVLIFGFGKEVIVNNYRHWKNNETKNQDRA